MRFNKIINEKVAIINEKKMKQGKYQIPEDEKHVGSYLVLGWK